ncbi:hypothetical protein Ancab_037275 [Ancistrocladus abbreviatus]
MRISGVMIAGFTPCTILSFEPTTHCSCHSMTIYGTVDKSSDSLYENTLGRQEESADVVHLTHLTTLQSVYHLRLGFASLASRPLASKWYLWAMWPTTAWLMILTRVYGRTFIVERNTFKQVKLQSWAVPRYSTNYTLQRQRVAINKLIEEAILEAEDKGVKVAALRMDEYEKLKIVLAPEYRSNLIHSKSCTQKALAEMYVIQIMDLLLQFSPKKICEDCFYLNPPSMVAPKSFENLHSCEVSSLKHSAPLFCIDVNWLPRRVMSAWRIAGILHALEGWNVNECGDRIFGVDKICQAALEHGFLPLSTPLQL